MRFRNKFQPTSFRLTMLRRTIISTLRDESLIRALPA
jgi:hypothetical protein